MSRRGDPLDPLARAMAAAPATVDTLGIVAEQAATVMRGDVGYWRVFVRLRPQSLA